MSKTFSPTFNVHTFSTVSYSPQDVPYASALQNTQFSWSLAGPSSSSIQPPTSVTPSITNGVSQPSSIVLPPKKLLKNKHRTEEELKITHTTAERFSVHLAQDHAAVLQPDVDAPFVDHADVVRRLLPYHIYQQPREDCETLNGRKGKQKALESDLRAEIKETRFALQCHRRYLKLRDRFHITKIRTASRSAADGQAYILAQAVLEADRVDASLLSNELKAARGELERLERERRATAATTARTQYAPAPAMTTLQAQYYRPYPYAYTQAYGAPIPPPTTSTFQISPSPSTPNQGRANTAIPVQLPVASLPALHALGIHPVPVSSVTEGQPPPPAVLRGSTANGTMLTLEINVSLLQSAQMSGLAMVLNSLMSRTNTNVTVPPSPSAPPGTVSAASTVSQNSSTGSVAGSRASLPRSTTTPSHPSHK